MNNRPASPKENEFPAGESVAFDFEAFEDNVRAHGPTFVHYRAMPDPIGLISKDDSRRPDFVQNPNVSNGMYFIEAGTFHALFQGNTKETRATTGGVTDPAVAQITPSCFYEDGKRVYLSNFDRLYLTNSKILVTHTDLHETSVTGIDKLRFPVEEVLDIVDADGQLYDHNSFDVVKGNIVWKQGVSRPGYNVEANRGKVYSIRFLYRPYWYVFRMVHELRVVQTINNEGKQEIIQAQQAAIVAREYYHQGQPQALGKADTDRTVEGPRDN